MLTLQGMDVSHQHQLVWPCVQATFSLFNSLEDLCASVGNTVSNLDLPLLSLTLTAPLSLLSSASGPQSSAEHGSVRELPALPGYFQPGGDLPGRARAAGFSIPGVSAAPFLLCFCCGARKETLTFMVSCTALSYSLSQRDSQLWPDKQRAGAVHLLFAVCLPFPVGQTKLLAACYYSFLLWNHLRKDWLSNYIGNVPPKKLSADTNSLKFAKCSWILSQSQKC